METKKTKLKSRNSKPINKCQFESLRRLHRIEIKMINPKRDSLINSN